MKYSIPILILSIICIVLEQTNIIFSYQFWLAMGMFVAFFSSKPLWKAASYFYYILAILFGFIHLFILPSTIYSPYVGYYLLSVMSSLDKNARNNIPLFINGALLTIHAIIFLDPISLSLLLIILFVIFLSAIIYIKKLILSNHHLLEEKQSYLLEYRKINRQIRDQEQSAAVKERNRIARDLHDSVGHQLTALMMQLQVAEIQLSSMPEQQKLLKQSKDMARQSLQEMRVSVQALQNESVKGIEAVIQLIRKLEAESHVRVQLVTKPQAMSIVLNEEQNVAVYRFIQEGLTNAMRHAYSREVELTLEVIAEHSYGVKLTNRAHQTTWEEGFGLKNLHTRFTSLNGQFYARMNWDHFEINGSFPITQPNQKGREGLDGENSISRRSTDGETRTKNDD